MAKEKIKFYTAYSFPAVKADSHGNTNVTKFSLSIRPDGRKLKVFHSEYDQNEFIQSFADSCDLRTMLQKFVNGDETALGIPTGRYADVSNMPSDLLSASERTRILSKAYNELKPELRAELKTFEMFEDYVRNPQHYAKKKAPAAAPAAPAAAPAAPAAAPAAPAAAPAAPANSN